MAGALICTQHMDRIIDNLAQGGDDPEKVHSLLLEMNEEIAWIQPEEQEVLVPRILHTCSTLLRSLLCYESKVLIVRSLARLSGHEFMKPHVDGVLKQLMHMFSQDTEEIGLVILKIIVDWHKVFKTLVESHVPIFLDLVHRMYGQIEHQIAGFGQKNAKRTEKLAVHSFKVLSECPIVIVLFFQLYRKWMTEHIHKYFPLFFSTLSKPIAQLNLQASEAQKNDYNDYILMLAKTLSFVVYILRGFPTMVKPYRDQLPEIVLRLLKGCPAEASNIRKELLVATRHILSTDFKMAFVGHLNEFMDEANVLGMGYTSNQTLRHVSFSMLADFIYNVRMELGSQLLDRTIRMYSGCMHDYSMPINIQTMSAKLLLNMIDAFNGERIGVEERQYFLWKVFSSYTFKLEVISNTLELVGSNAYEFVSGHYFPEKFVYSLELNHDPIKEHRFLLKTVIAGLRIVLLNLRNTGQGAVISRENFQERGRFGRLVRTGIHCLSMFCSDHAKEYKDDEEPGPFIPAQKYQVALSISNEDKDMLDQFSQALTLIDGQVFYDVLLASMDHLFEHMVKNPVLVAIPQYFLSVNEVSKRTLGILLGYLAKQLPGLGNSKIQRVRIILRLYKLVFMALSAIPEDNEIVLQQFIGEIITGCIDQVSKTYEPVHYFYLLRSLFRSIGGGRFELLYKEVLPLLPTLLFTLNEFTFNTNDKQFREFVVELTMSVPVRLNVLLPHLGLLMRSVVLALNGGSELASQGLRTLELCIDNLTMEFLDPMLSPVIRDMVLALWKHCRPYPYPVALSHTAFRVLGKLSGRAQVLLPGTKLMEPLNQTRNHSQVRLEMRICEVNKADCWYETVSFPINGMIDQIYSTWKDGEPSSAWQRQTSFGVIRQLMVIGLGIRIEHLAIMKRLHRQLNSLENLVTKGTASVAVESEQLSTMIKILLLMASVGKDLGNEARNFLEDVYTFLAVASVLALDGNTRLPMGEKMDQSVVLGELFNVLPDENMQLLSIRKGLLVKMCEKMLEFGIDEQMDVSLANMFTYLGSRLCSLCYAPSAYQRKYGCEGLHYLCHIAIHNPACSQVFSIDWYWGNELRFCRGLFHTLKGQSPFVSLNNHQLTRQTLVRLLTHGHGQTEKLADDETHLSNVVGFLAHGLSDNSIGVREMARFCLEHLSGIRQSRVGLLLQPFRERLLIPVLTKPLGALPFAAQQSHVEALIYLLKQEPSLIPLDDTLLGIVHEAIGFVETEESNTTPKFRGAARFKASCVELLGVVMNQTDFLGLNQLGTRNRIISIFFKGLYSKSDEIIQVSQKALQNVIDMQHRLPKDLLQHGLRPVLVNLSDYKRLTTSGLEGLGRLLRLLTSYFKVEIGQKLLGHIKQWSDHCIQSNHGLGASWIGEAPEVGIIVAILNIFQLLPANSHIFVGEVVSVIVRLEEHLGRVDSSPFRSPLVPYLQKYKEQTVEYFLDQDRLLHPGYVGFFASILGMDKEGELRARTIEELPRMMGEMDRKARDLSTKLYQVMRIVKEISSGWNSDSVDLEMDLVIDALSSLLQGCEGLQGTIMVDYVHVLSKHDQRTRFQELGIRKMVVLRKIAELFRFPGLDTVYLRRMISSCIGSMDRNEKRQAIGIVREFLHGTDPIVSVVGIQQILGAIIQDKEVVDTGMIKEISEMIWKRENIQMSEYWTEKLIMECVEQSIGLVENHFAVVSRARQVDEVTRFVFRHLDETLDPLCRQMLNQLGSLLIFKSKELQQRAETQKRLEKIVHRCLSCVGGESRQIIRRTMENVFSVPQHLEFGIRPFELVLQEDTNTINHHVNVLNVMIGTPKYFYPHRRLLIPAIMGCLGKLVIGSSNIPENKHLAVDLIRLVLEWKELSEQEGVAIPNFVVPHLLQFIVRLLVLSTAGVAIDLGMVDREKLYQSGLQIKCLEAYSQYLDVVASLDEPERHFSFPIFERQFSISVNETLGELLEEQVYPSLILIDLLVRFLDRCDNPSLTSMALSRHVPSLFGKLFVSGNILVVQYLFPLVRVLYEEAVNNPQSTNMAPFLDFGFVEESLTKETHLTCALAGIRAIFSVNHVSSAGQFVYSTIPLLIKVLDSISTQIHEWIGGNNQVGTTSARFVHLVSVYLTVISSLELQISRLGEHKAGFLQVLDSCMVGGFPAVVLCYIVHMVTEWIRSQEGTFNIKEKIVLVTFCTRLLESTHTGSLNFNSHYEQIIAALVGTSVSTISGTATPLKHRIFDLVHLVYLTPEYQRTEMTARFEAEFLTIWSGKRLNSFVELERDDRRNEYSFKFLQLLDESLPTNALSRLEYIFSVQRWEFISEVCWVGPALELLLMGARDLHGIQSSGSEQTLLLEIVELISQDFHQSQVVWGLVLEQLIEKVMGLVSEPTFEEFRACFVAFLKQPYHFKQQREYPNGISTLLETVWNIRNKTGENMVPADLASFLAKNFRGWYSGMLYLEENVEASRKNHKGYSISSSDPLAELYSTLMEKDMYCGHWRRKCLFVETGLGLSLEQGGHWAQAQAIYEYAQSRARAGLLPTADGKDGVCNPLVEFHLWEDRWLEAGIKLQQWDMLVEVGRLDNHNDASLEGSWRLLDWTLPKDQMALKSILEGLSDVPTPKRKFLEAFLCLNQTSVMNHSNARTGDFYKLLEEGSQTLLLWGNSLPPVITNAHVPLVYCFQQFVELQESQPVYTALGNGGSYLGTSSVQDNRHSGIVQELKGTLSTWRDRLPRKWDDIGIWSELGAWRQHVFSAMNTVLFPIMESKEESHPSRGMANGTQTNPFVYRGYHETAWMINQFAKIARKQGLTSVCNQMLNRIYTLPNIEVQDAFFKLREQAKCHLATACESMLFQINVRDHERLRKIYVDELTAGLEIINATNLGYFNGAQQAEFFVFKAQFMSRLGLGDEANRTFAQAVQLDLNCKRGWAKWAEYNDVRFQSLLDAKPVEFETKQGAMDPVFGWGVHAIHCYLQAATLDKARGTKYLARVLWLLALDNEAGLFGTTFETYGGNVPVLRWTPLIPQLIAALDRKEAKQARLVLGKICKSYPQAVFFHLKTAQEEFRTADPDDKRSRTESNGALEHVTQLFGELKTHHPFLTACLENLVESLIHRLRPTPDEDLYRIIVTILQEGYSTEGEVMRLALEKVSAMISNVQHSNHKYKQKFDQDFLGRDTPRQILVSRLEEWKDRLGSIVRLVPQELHMEHFSHYLAEFEYQKSEEVEIPGQYVQAWNGWKEPVRLERICPVFQVIRRHGTSYRRVQMMGSDGTAYYFLVQNPSSRNSRGEERLLQMFRAANHVLAQKKETQSRGLFFNVPWIIPISAHVRLVQEEETNVCLEQVLADHCSTLDPIGFGLSSTDQVSPDHVARFCAQLMEKPGLGQDMESKTEGSRLEVFEKARTQFVPHDVLTKYVAMVHKTSMDYWFFRDRFTRQYASWTVLSYAMGVYGRLPHKFLVSDSGNVTMIDAFGTLDGQETFESVPFRLTPNIQHFIGQIGIDGVFIPCMFALAKILTSPDFILEDLLRLWAKDERDCGTESARELLHNVSSVVDIVYKRMLTLACIREQQILYPAMYRLTRVGESAPDIQEIHGSIVPLHQSLLDLVSVAVNPRNLCKMDPHWHPWF